VSVKVKVCGITNGADALAAAAAGADMIGFVFADSPRRIGAGDAAAIAGALPAGILKVGVFVDEDPVVVEMVAAISGLDLLQFHGNETPEYCAPFGARAIKAIRVKDEGCLCEVKRYGDTRMLLDTYVAGTAGGTGLTFDWGVAARVARDKPIILSGGLTPDNVAEALTIVNPYAVDVSSGVESAPGKKDAAKMREFVLNAKRRHLD
jgi:phosphoribosylanthranilate isomerase